MAGPLAGLRVLDLTRVLAGPYCTMLLGDLGADVVKVEQPGSGDDTRRWGPPYLGDEALYYLSINRNKRSVTINLKDPRGVALVKRLAAVRGGGGELQGWWAGADGAGLRRAARAQPVAGLLLHHGFGPDGPYRERPGYDFVAQAMGGIMSLTGEPEGEPLKHGIAVADITTGMLAAFRSWRRCTTRATRAKASMSMSRCWRAWWAGSARPAPAS